jgi:hypothetical protein
MRQNGKPSQQVLNSWKEISSYLNRGVRTVQRWEHQFGLPVRHLGKGKRGPVYAFVTELNFWIATSGVLTIKPQPISVERQPGNPVEESRRLMSNMHSLAQNLANATLQQRQQAELLQRRILEMRERMKQISP